MKNNRIFYLILLLWVCVDLLTALFVNIHSDEAYYALYGARLAWGYYDHPPMVALLAHCSALLFDGILGVRFCTILMHAGTLWLVWKTLSAEERDAPHAAVEFCIIAASLTMFVIYGFTTTPDAPLLFFTALFFHLYKKYVELKAGETSELPETPQKGHLSSGKGWFLATAIGVTVAAMMYSKYMGVLVVAFVILSNLRLLRDIRVWYALSLALLLFTPHLVWQVQNHFPSFTYHLIARNTHFRIAFPLEYIPNQLLVFNPIAFCLALYFCWERRKTADLFEKACLYTIVGFILFFWVMTVKGHAEPHWTVAASVPMLIVLFRNLHKEGWSKWIYRLILPMAALLIVARIALCFNVLAKSTGYGSRKDYLSAIQKLDIDRPVVFIETFQNPSLYRFYTGKDATTLSTLRGRRSQYDILQLDTAWQGRPVIIFGNIPGAKDTVIDNITIHYRSTGHFQGTNRIVVELNQCDFLDGDSVRVHYTLTNPYPVNFDLANTEFPVSITAVYKTKEGYQKYECPITERPSLYPNGWIRCTASFPLLHNTPMVFSLYNGVCETVNSKPHILAP